MSLLSPDVNIKEITFGGVIPLVQTTAAAVAGRFNRGPLNVPVLISGEDELVQIFGKPDSTNYMEWFCAAQFLNYSSSLYVVRAEPTGILNATISGTGFLIDNANTFYGLTSANKTTIGTFAAKDPGLGGNDLGVIIVDNSGWAAFKTWAATITTMPSNRTFDQYFTAQPGTSAFVSALAVNPAEAKNDEVHVLVYDNTGNVTGTRYTVLEVFQGLSKVLDAVDRTGSPLYAVDKINLTSKYLWMTSFPTTSTATSTNFDANTGIYASQLIPVGYTMAAFDVVSTGTTYSLQHALSGGVAGTTATDAQIITAYGTVANKDTINIGHLITAGHDIPVIQYVVQDVASGYGSGRGDCVAYGSVYNTTVGTPIKDTDTTPEQEAVTCKQSWNINDSDGEYFFVDSGYKYIYDKYNRMYRWIPLNGDTAGIAARLGFIAQEYYSPGGFNRGGVKNVVKLAFNPTKAQRDVLYPNSINAVVNFVNDGPTLYGDKMATVKPGPFSRYNVRRLFIILEKAIGTAAKYDLFEFNDTFTQAGFKAMVNPFLGTIQGNRGISDYLVTCDGTNNTPDIVNSNQFVGSVYVKPAHSINNITLNFVATPAGVTFSTVIG